MKNTLKITIASLGLFALSACSVNADTPDIPGVGPQDTSGRKIGNEYTGFWETDCIESQWGNGEYRKIHLDIEGDSLTYTQRYFEEELCENEKPDSRETFEGTMEKEASLSGDRVAIYFKIPTQGAAFTWKNFNIKKNSAYLMISDFYGSFDTPENIPTDLELLPSTELEQPGTAKPIPEEPKPEPVPEEPALNLETGLYKVVEGDKRLCDQMVSIMSIGGEAVQIYIDLQSPCSGKITFFCDKGTCTKEDLTIQILTFTSYELTNTDGKKSIFELR